jgi:hypothetical protein
MWGLTELREFNRKWEARAAEKHAQNKLQQLAKKLALHIHGATGKPGSVHVCDVCAALANSIIDDLSETINDRL